jgi:hypothetical protein
LTPPTAIVFASPILTYGVGALGGSQYIGSVSEKPDGYGRGKGASTILLTPSSSIRFSLLASGLRLAAVLFRVAFCRLSGVMHGVMKVTLCSVGVVRRCFVVACFVMFRSLAMMTGCVVVVFGSFSVMFRSLLGHLSS